jgi:serine/threonine-protein kinase
MAPEQAMGKASDVDARADIWAMGATLFAMMSGLTVHEGDSGRELLVKLVTQPTRSLLSVEPEVPRSVAEVVDRALAVDREKRWPSAADMRDALDAASRGLWQDRPPRSVLVSLAEPMVAEPAPSSKPSQDPEAQKRSQVPAAAPTLRAQERPEPSDPPPKPTVETARAVSHERIPSGTRRRMSPRVLFASLAIFVVLVVVVLAGNFVATGLRGRNGPPPSFSSSAEEADSFPAASPSVASAAGSPSIAASVTSASPTAETAIPPADAARAGRPRNAPSKEHEATPAAQTPSSSPVAASASAELPPAASARPAPPNCTPPYYYDSKMNRVFKKECLQ